eukprot:6182324-Pleurochrysis_carterae.AAC.2
MGFHGSGARGNELALASLEAVRWQCERCDWCAGVLMTHALGGGTGSGTGSFLMQAPALFRRADSPARPVSSFFVMPL